MQIFTPEELEDDILNELMEEINELYEASEQTLIELELRPEDNELQRSLFRSIHTIKGDLGLVNFTPMIPLLQHVEDLLDFLRKGQVHYTSTMSDLVLLTMDQVKSFVQKVMNDGHASYDEHLHEQLVKAIARISPQNHADHEQLLTEAVKLLNPALADNESQNSGEQKSLESGPPATVANTGILKTVSGDKREDMVFFRNLMQTIEHRSNYWAGRGDRIAKLALYINHEAGNPIDDDQLSVACYVHDFGMAFMPLSLLNKTEPFTQAEFNLMRSHVYKSARLLEHLEHWNLARKIVMQHHERVDGSGYPLGLRDEDICDGAKLLAILDTFDAMTHSRAHHPDNRMSKKQAVIALNRDAEGQFCSKWVRHFNLVMTRLLTQTS